MYCFIVFCMLIPAVKLDNFTDTTEYPESSRYSDLSGCYNKTGGFKGSVEYLIHPEKNMSSMVCEWNIGVPKDYVVELEFKVFQLPVLDVKDCDSYIEISYLTTQDEMIKRRVCPSDTLGKISTGSQEVHIFFKSGQYPVVHQNDVYGFRINYRAVAVNKPSGNYAVSIVLLTLATVFIIALIFSCFISRHKPNSGANVDVPLSEVVLSPNAPTRAELQTAFELQRHVLQAPQRANTYLDRTSSRNSKISAKESFRNHHPPVQPQTFQKKPKISIGPTPHKNLDESRRKWSSETIRNLRTRLIERFSSHSTSSDISVFFEAPSRLNYSQLSCKGSPDVEPTAPEREGEVFRPVPNIIPSVVVELID